MNNFVSIEKRPPWEWITYPSNMEFEFSGWANDCSKPTIDFQGKIIVGQLIAL